MTNSVKTPLFSIVTICYNPGDLIRKTIESVLAQCSSIGPASFEYIIQDGLSTDNTAAIVKSYMDYFEKKGISLIFNSEKDNGIYDAMNKGASCANGKYVIFMNADDCFYSDHVLSDITTALKSGFSEAFTNDDCFDESLLPDIVYGDCIVAELGMFFKFRKCYELIKERMPFSHQACFADRQLLLNMPLNTDYKITADYDFLLKCHLLGKTFFDSNVEIALVTADGLSSIHMLDTFIEVNEVCRSQGHPRYDDKSYNKKLKEMKLKQFVLSYFPNFIKLIIRKNQIKNRGQITSVTLPPWFNSN